MKADATSVRVRGGCRVCDPPGVWRWDQANAMATAARHHAATGHETWVEQTLHVYWGRVASGQGELFPA